ncbi:MAG: hypothetical protein ACTHM5_10845 [Ginsengibacter sp.]
MAESGFTMREIVKIFLSNWINLLTIFISLFIITFLSAIIQDKFTFSDAVFGTTFSILAYGMIFWIGFIIFILILDVILFGLIRGLGSVTYKLLAEWIIISAPFIYWLIKYREWIFMVAVLAFLLGQFLRRRFILQLYRKDDTNWESR